MAAVTFHAIVHGRVQGVFFRAGTRDEALRLGVGGWVRNLPDGTVEVSAMGGEPELQALLDWLHHGPPGARVERVDVEWGAAATPVPKEFTIAG